ncbi:hypothetical protein AGMMS49928_28510 [Spirochaetia bacterium]|nr:hypothetical protein AGMMS49928_28510 [Spirochaetia bacterium]
MAQRTDWLSASRTDQLSMANVWNTAFSTHDTEWNIAAPVQVALEGLINIAEEALNKAKDESTRTPVATAQCKTAFDNWYSVVGQGETPPANPMISANPSTPNGKRT